MNLSLKFKIKILFKQVLKLMILKLNMNIKMMTFFIMCRNNNCMTDISIVFNLFQSFNLKFLFVSQIIILI